MTLANLFDALFFFIPTVVSFCFGSFLYRYMGWPCVLPAIIAWLTIFGAEFGVMKIVYMALPRPEPRSFIQRFLHPFPRNVTDRKS